MRLQSLAANGIQITSARFWDKQ